MKKVIILLILGVVVALVLSEIALRLLSPQRIEPTKCRKFDSILDHSLVPNSNCRFKTKEWDVDFKVNSYGLRDYEYPLQKPAQTYRILMLGDSFIEGFGAEVSDTFGKILERSLTEFSGKKIEVINAGVSGWGPLSEYLYLREYGIKFQPDLVILNFNATDFYDDWDYYSRLTTEAKQLLQNEDDLKNTSLEAALSQTHQQEVFTPKPLYTESVNDPNNIPFVSDKIKFFLNKNFYTYRFLTRSIKLFFGRANIVEVSPQQDRGKIEKDLFAITRKDDINEYRELFTKPKEDILKMKKLTENHNAKLFIVLVPHGHMVNGREWGTGRIPWGFEKNKVYSTQSLQEIAKWAKENTIESFDLTPNLKEAAKDQKLYFTYDGHWNKKGHVVVAQALLGVLYNKLQQ